ncbi:MULTISPECIES: DUF1405 domain-containing protein [Exiguobacterium]|uniref:DUF1405 domain-containing protein n=1 Tax=Exiguobacterium TaxID=33986 RepID=UPI00087793CF|nr:MULTISPECIES: DUF1405 domain-containing protein [Exiguobacterium]TCI27355.1 DUF1405 domain-containing protein [Exiguobacterium sp. SH5S4]TCI57885.1 DUF1405 domain-containing protein [Exiguobacterium sp. SH5S13]TCI66038.1 DUF1405 domain-containing protein [Exiguobacterium sp. SH3S1]
MNYTLLLPFLKHKAVLTFLFIVNLLGTIYGYVWYEPQLRDTPLIYWPFVPDSPTASLFFTIVLALWLLKKSSPLIETLAFITLVKYGVWAVVMNVLFLMKLGDDADTFIVLMAVMLMLSHGAMAVQAFLYAPFMRWTVSSFVLTLIWVIHNDVVDYVLGQWPRYPSLAEHIMWIGYGSFWLTGICFFVGYRLILRASLDNKFIRM